MQITHSFLNFQVLISGLNELKPHSNEMDTRIQFIQKRVSNFDEEQKKITAPLNQAWELFLKRYQATQTDEDFENSFSDLRTSIQAVYKEIFNPEIEYSITETEGSPTLISPFVEEKDGSLYNKYDLRCEARYPELLDLLRAIVSQTEQGLWGEAALEQASKQTPLWFINLPILAFLHLLKSDQAPSFFISQSKNHGQLTTLVEKIKESDLLQLDPDTIGDYFFEEIENTLNSDQLILLKEYQHTIKNEIYSPNYIVQSDLSRLLTLAHQEPTHTNVFISLAELSVSCDFDLSSRELISILKHRKTEPEKLSHLLACAVATNKIYVIDQLLDYDSSSAALSKDVLFVSMLKNNKELLAFYKQEQSLTSPLYFLYAIAGGHNDLIRATLDSKEFFTNENCLVAVPLYIKRSIDYGNEEALTAILSHIKLEDQTLEYTQALLMPILQDLEASTLSILSKYGLLDTFDASAIATIYEKAMSQGKTEVIRLFLEDSQLASIVWSQPEEAKKILGASKGALLTSLAEENPLNTLISLYTLGLSPDHSLVDMMLENLNAHEQEILLAFAFNSADPTILSKVIDKLQTSLTGETIENALSKTGYTATYERIEKFAKEGFSVKWNDVLIESIKGKNDLLTMQLIEHKLNNIYILALLDGVILEIQQKNPMIAMKLVSAFVKAYEERIDYINEDLNNRILENYNRAFIQSQAFGYSSLSYHLFFSNDFIGWNEQENRLIENCLYIQ